MQYHYVVYYDTEEKKWDIELDTTAYFREGHAWSPDMVDETSYGFFTPEIGTPEYVLDESLWRTLLYITDTFPIPEEAS
jgi:hypothetical protein